MHWHLSLIALEVFFITFLNYKAVETYYSLDILYCLPVIQVASLSSIRALRRSDSQIPTLVAILSALAWGLSELAIAWPDYPMDTFALNIFTRSVTLTVMGRVMTKLWREREYSRKDALTDLANRLEFLERFEIEQLRSERSGNPYSLLYIDIDQFKALNDSQGHHAGDDALKALATLLRENSRAVDTVARIGGDEFVLLLPKTDMQARKLLINRIKLASENKFKHYGWPIALSIGAVTEIGKERIAEEILHEADKDMYSRKASKVIAN